MSDYYDKKSRVFKLLPIAGVEFAVTHFKGEEAISQLAHYHLKVFTASNAVDTTAILHQPLTLVLHDHSDQQSTRFFNGCVTHCKRQERFTLHEKSFTAYEIEFMPSLVRLTYDRDSRVYRKKTILEIAEEVFSRQQLNYKIKPSREKHPVHDYIVQQNESDFNFIARLLESEGVFYYFQQDATKDTVILADAITGYMQYAPKVIYRKRNLRNHQLTTWAANWQVVSGKIALTDYDFEEPSAYSHQLMKQHLVTGTAEIKIPDKFAKLAQFHYPGGYKNADEGEAVARWHGEIEQAKFNRYIGRGNYTAFSPALTFELISEEDLGAVGEYVITHIRHSAHDLTYFQQANTLESTTQSYENSFYSLPKDFVYRHPKTTQKPLGSGSQSAKIVGPENEEIFTDHYRRVTVQFFWDRYGNHDENSSCMMRVLQSWAGEKFGVMFTPRINHEVVVQFIDGDLDRPFISGSLHNAQHMPPYDHEATRTKNGIVTRSTKGGTLHDYNELHFDDAKENELIYLQAQKNLAYKIKNDYQSEILQNSDTKITGNRTITLHKGNDMLNLEKGHYTAEIAGSARFNGQMIKIAVADNYLLINQSGVTIKGKKVEINP